MKYKINEKRILEILHKYDDDFEIEDNEIKLKYSDDDVFSVTDDRIEHIKRGCVDPECAFFDNMITEKLHEHFNECFEEIKPKYSYEKCKKFLEDNGYKYDDDERLIYYDNFNVNDDSEFPFDLYTVIRVLYDVLNSGGGVDEVLSVEENMIATLFYAHKDKLLEE